MIITSKRAALYLCVLSDLKKLIETLLI